MATDAGQVVEIRRASAATLIAVTAGNCLEFYDFLSFSFFTVSIARVMFPAGAPGSALLLTLMTGSLGFLARPVGAVVFGALGDRIGRRPTMLATFALMGSSALGLALTPTYAQIGVAAPVLVVIFRLAQGLAAGGDVGPTTAYLTECGGAERRGLRTSLQLGAMRTGAAMSGVVGLVLAGALGGPALDAYGWRIAFGIGAVIVPFAYVLRRRLEETLHLPEPDPRAPRQVRVGPYLINLLGVAGALVMAAMGDFMFTYERTWLHLSSGEAYGVTIVFSSVQALFCLVGGWLSDRYGRRAPKLALGILGLATSAAAFAWMTSAPSLTRLYVLMVWLAMVSSAAFGASFASFIETAPKRQRSGLIGIGYGLVVGATFGLAPPIATSVIRATGDLNTPAYVWSLGFVLLVLSGVIGVETHPDLAGARLRRRAGAPSPG